MLAGENFELPASFAQRQSDKRFSVLVGEEIENDEERGMRGREFLHATGRGMQAELKFVERKCATDRNRKLAVDHETFRGDALKLFHHIGEITRQRLTR